MQILESFLLTLSMFTAIPVSNVAWTKENQRLAMVFLPSVGLLIGLGLWLFAAIARALRFSSLLTGAGFFIIPILVTGGVHLDGFIDTVDALSSHAAQEKKRAILKDPHVGAFAVIYMGAYLAAYFAAASELPAAGFSALILTLNHVLARAVGALAVIYIPSSSETGLAAAFSGAADQKTSMGILIAVIAFITAFLISLAPLPGIAMAAAAASVLFFTRRMADKNFGGMSGDIAGFLISTVELALLLCYVLFVKVVQL